MIIKKKFDDKTIKTVLVNEARTEQDMNDELSLLWKAVEDLAVKLNVDLPEECVAFRNKLKAKKQSMKNSS